MASSSSDNDSDWKSSGGARTGKNALVEARTDLDKAPLNRKGVAGDTQGSKVRAGSGKGRVIDESDSDDGDELTRACAQSKKQRVVSDSESEESEVGSDLNSKSVALTSRKSRPETIQGVGNAERKARVSQTMQDSEDVMDEDSKVTNAPSGACQHSPGSASEEKRGWVYKLVNQVTNKGYVGQTVKDKIEKRMSGHKNAWRRIGAGCRLLNASIKKHGWEAFRLEVLERPPISDLDIREEIMIELHGTREPSGYNVLSGATEVPMKNPLVRARRAKTMEASEPRKRISDGVLQARKRCTPEEHAVWVENVRIAQTTPEMLKQRSDSQKRVRSSKTPEDLAEWNLKSAQGMQQRAAKDNEAKLATMSVAEGEKWLRKLQATRDWRKRQKQARTAETTANNTKKNRL